ncbi:uncharacterized protein N7483_008605 [Penicillium malachiteum]|uniref:uncharacterized protein n=1 Tax=Penicillium malachiteum TaxID=1324776 RepID=UPI002546D4DA|nr:uncharacterized protein N7483_008605 [Penicillium malachiteum]KAJ5720671.1 hypothetical protein N7483_008605 [Penicillium malachiteum]
MSIPNSVQQLFSGGNTQSQEKQTYKEWLQEAYNNGYERWMPWIEDQYLKWFGKGDNKVSYATKDSLSKTKVTGVNQVDQLQDDTNNLLGNQLGDKGLLKPVGQFVSKEGVNRAERNGKDENGSYGNFGTLTDAGSKGINTLGSGVAQGAESAKKVTSSGLAGIQGLVSDKQEE